MLLTVIAISYLLESKTNIKRKHEEGASFIFPTLLPLKCIDNLSRYLKKLAIKLLYNCILNKSQKIDSCKLI